MRTITVAVVVLLSAISIVSVARAQPGPAKLVKPECFAVDRPVLASKAPNIILRDTLNARLSAGGFSEVTSVTFVPTDSTWVACFN
jgi:hypothetical protein